MKKRPPLPFLAKCIYCVSVDLIKCFVFLLKNTKTKTDEREQRIVFTFIEWPITFPLAWNWFFVFEFTAQKLIEKIYYATKQIAIYYNNFPLGVKNLVKFKSENTTIIVRCCRDHGRCIITYIYATLFTKNSHFKHFST